VREISVTKRVTTIRPIHTEPFNKTSYLHVQATLWTQAPDSSRPETQ